MQETMDDPASRLSDSGDPPPDALEATPWREQAAAAGLRVAARQQDLLQNAQDIIYTHDMERFTAVNPAVEAITGYKPEEIVGMRLADILTSESVLHSRRMLDQKVDDGNNTTTYNVDILAKDGHRVPLEISSWIIYEDGRPVGVQGIARDLTERQRTERALRESEARFRRLADRAHDYIYRFELRPHGHFSYCSPAVTRMFGYTPDEFYADPDLPLKILIPDDRPASALVLTGQQVAEDATLRVRRKDGQIIWAEFRRVPVFDEQGTLVAVEAVVRDVTERKRAEDDQRFLARAGELLAGTLDEREALTNLARLAVPELADWCTVDIVQADGSTVALGGSHVDPTKVALIAELQRFYPPDRLGRQPISQVLREGRSLLLSTITEADLRASSRDDNHYQLRRALSYQSAMFVPLRARDRLVGIITLVSAVGERRYASADLLLAEELARRAALAVDNARLFREAQQAIQKRDEFLSVAAHELKTPITSLRGFAQLLARRLDRDRPVSADQLRRAIGTIDLQSRKLAHLIGQLLDVTRLDAGRLTLDRTPADVAALVRRVVDLLPVTPSHHSITVVAPPTATAIVDAVRLEQVLTNLLDNAVKYSPDGGPIDVELVTAPPLLRITVADRGVGVGDEQRAQIFDRFYQGHGDHASGIGLGLYISRQIVELHGGRLDVQDRPGAGSCFVVTLPDGLS